MPIGIERINDPNVHPNTAITFITPLKTLPNHAKAQEMLEAVAAQFKPIMKDRGYAVTSLTEHEHNKEFAGRNWNAGEIIELVLRRPNQGFAPYLFVLSVMCHELAHIEQMNHSSAFQKVNGQIKAELRELRTRNYFGDGFWSHGRSLVYGNDDRPFLPAEVPEVPCGGANFTRGYKKRHNVGQAFQHGRSLEPSKKVTKARAAAAKPGRTGRQTDVPRKAGSRVVSTKAFKGAGQSLSADPEESTFGKRANARSAVELRLAAAEARMRASQPVQPKPEPKTSPPRASTSTSGTSTGDVGSIDLVSSDEDEAFDDEDDVASTPGEEPTVKREDELDAEPLTQAEQDYIKDEFDGWEDDFLFVQGGAGSATASPSDGRKGKKRATEADDSPRKRAGGAGFAGGGGWCNCAWGGDIEDFARELAQIEFEAGRARVERGRAWRF